MDWKTLPEPGLGQREKEEASEEQQEKDKKVFVCTHAHLLFSQQQQPVTLHKLPNAELLMI